MAFRSIYAQGFVRAAVCGFCVSPANPAANVRAILAVARVCHEDGVAVAVFPELCVSGYAIEDLLHQAAVLDGVEQALAALAAASAGLLPLLLIGAPLRAGGRLFNCAVAIHRGRILGVVPKTYLPNYREFYEKRHFASGERTGLETLRIGSELVPFGPDLLFAARDIKDFVLHAEICEDFWVPIPPSSHAALAGATVLANLSASNITIGKAETRSLLCRAQSLRCAAAYLYAAAGAGESTTDLAWDGQAAIFELGSLLTETERFPTQQTSAIADLDLRAIMAERMRLSSFEDNRAAEARPFRRIEFSLSPPDTDVGLRRTVAKFPFVPADPALLSQDCYEAYSIQVAGLAQRLDATGTRRVVIGVSGGLDSTQALLVAASTFDRLGWPRSDILGYTMPGFATGDESRARAQALMAALGVSAHTLDIRPSAALMLETLDHPAAMGAASYDLTYENVQAGLRTDYLFRLANQHGALVLGTGDLSELALGWCTYGVGDQMAHYAVNAGVPKTLIQHLIRWTATQGVLPDAASVLDAILAAEITPELIPGATQSTEAAIGPYALHDFFLFYTLRYGFDPGRIAFLALTAWGKEYPLEEIRHWLRLFLRRFFGFAQFKRSAMPNGPKVSGGGALSPRGDWRAPSDGSAQLWLAALDDGLAE